LLCEGDGDEGYGGAFVLGLLATSSAFAKEICGASEGYRYYPNVGRGKPGEWCATALGEIRRASASDRYYHMNSRPIPGRRYG
jgi:hypothetical protein